MVTIHVDLRVCFIWKNTPTIGKNILLAAIMEYGLYHGNVESNLFKQNRQIAHQK